MKKITFLVAAVLASAGMSAQTVLKWGAYNNTDIDTAAVFPWSSTFATWVEETGSIDDQAKGFADGSVALFNDEALGGLGEDYLGEWATNSPVITVSQLGAIGGIRAENSEALTINLSPADETVTFEGTEGATLVKVNNGILYTDIINNLPGGTIVKGGRVARYSDASAASRLFGPTVTAEGEGSIDLGKNNSGTYKKLTADLVIPEGSTMNVYMSRYSMFTADSVKKVTGAGTLNFYSRGDRAFLGGGSKGETEPTYFGDFTGDIHVYQDPDFADNGAAFYGVILATHSAKGKGATSQYYDRTSGDSLLYNVSRNNPVLLDSLVYDWNDIDLTVHSNGAVAVGSAGNDAGSNITLLKVKSLNVEKEGTVVGYYKDSNPQLAIIFGSDNADGHLDGTFTAMPKGSEAPYYPWRECGVALFKQGTGTYYVTSNENQFFQGVEVWEGRMLFNNSLDTATATGQHKLSTNNVVTCRPTGTIGGYGTIGGHTALYGTMQPGSDAIGTLSIDGTYALVGYAEKTPTAAVQERKAGSAANLLLYNGASIEFEIINKDKHDEVFVQNQVRLYSDTEGGTDAKINIKLSPRDEWSLAAGDTMVLLKADSLVSFVDGVDLTNYFELSTDGFGDATFGLKSVQIPGEYKYEMNFETGEVIKTQLAAPKYMLVAEVLTAGSGSAEPDAIESVDADNSNLQVYPNPAVDGNVTVAVAAGEMAQVAIYNSAAQMVKSVATSESTLTLDVSDLQAGIYYVRVMTADKAYTQKLIVK